jgi:hypothetical protein
MGKMVAAWAVFQTPATARECGRTTVCSQPEWDAIEREWPGRYTLVRGNIASEAEAERVARAASGYVAPSRSGGVSKARASKRPPRPSPTRPVAPADGATS